MYNDIKCLNGINQVDKEKVGELVNSLLQNGWNGEPILYTTLGLVTGSHRLAALKQLENKYWDYEDEIQTKIDDIFENIETIDVTDIINEYCENNDCSWDNIDFSSLGHIFKGTEIEQYKNDIEW